MDDVISLAQDAHAGQMDKNGRERYINHPIAVADLVTRAGGSEHQQMAALLHDVVEDTPLTLDDLRTAGVPEPVLEMVDALTRRDGEDYDDYLARILRCPPAIMVKRCDIAHNTLPERLVLLDPATADRLRRKYTEAASFLDEGERWLTQGRAEATILAGAALSAAMAGAQQDAAEIVQRISNDHGGRGVHVAILGWCDSIANRLEVEGITPGQVLGINFVQFGSDNQPTEPEDVPPPARWAGRLIAARVALDEVMFNTLMDALPHDPAQVGTYVLELLYGCANWLRRARNPDTPPWGAPWGEGMVQ